MRISLSLCSIVLGLWANIKQPPDPPIRSNVSSYAAFGDVATPLAVASSAALGCLVGAMAKSEAEAKAVQRRRHWMAEAEAVQRRRRMAEAEALEVLRRLRMADAEADGLARSSEAEADGFRLLLNLPRGRDGRREGRGGGGGVRGGAGSSTLPTRRSRSPRRGSSSARMCFHIAMAPGAVLNLNLAENVNSG